MSLTKVSYSMITGAPFNVLDYGADLTGSADSSAAIQAAITAAGENGMVFYPAGTYKISASVNLLPLQVHVGENATITVGSNISAFVRTTDGYPGKIRFENLVFTGTSETGKAINIVNNTPFVEINNCTFSGFSTAVYLDGSYCSNIQNSKFNGNSQGVLLVNECHSTQLINCLFQDNTTGLGINGTQSLGNLGGPTHNISSIGCAYQNGLWGVWAENVYEPYFVSTYCEGNTTEDFRFGVNDSGVYNRACYNLTVDTFQSSSPCGSGQNIDLNHCVNANLSGISFNAGCSTTASLLTVDGYSDKIWIDYNRYTTATVTATAPFNFVGNSASKVVLSNNGRFIFPYTMNGINFGTLFSETAQIYADFQSGSGRPALFITSTGSSSQDILVKAEGVERHYDASNNLRFSVDNVNSVIGVGYSFQPVTDNSYSIGDGSHRFTTVYATTGTINTSDANEKTEIVDLSEAEKRVALHLKTKLKRFKFKDAVKQKGDNARYHFGIIAQEVKAAFHVEGLDADKYGMFCYDEWEADPETGLEAGNRYGVRYEELLAFIIGAL